MQPCLAMGWLATTCMRSKAREAFTYDIGRSVSWCVGRLFCWLVGWLVCSLVGWLADWLVAWLAGWLVLWLSSSNTVSCPVSTPQSRCGREVLFQNISNFFRHRFLHRCCRLLGTPWGSIFYSFLEFWHHNPIFFGTSISNGFLLWIFHSFLHDF